MEGETIGRITFEEGGTAAEQWNHTRVSLDLDPGERQQSGLKMDMLPFQGSAAICVNPVIIRESSGVKEISRSRSNLYRLYTFMVYDRDYYRVNYLWPRRAQYTSATLAVIIILVGLVQIFM